MKKRIRKKKQKLADNTVKTFWEPDPDQPLYVRCSNCRFRIETQRAVETGWSISEQTGLRYRFCPACGKPMSLA